MRPSTAGLALVGVLVLALPVTARAVDGPLAAPRDLVVLKRQTGETDAAVMGMEEGFKDKPEQKNPTSTEIETSDTVVKPSPPDILAPGSPNAPKDSNTDDHRTKWDENQAQSQSESESEAQEKPKSEKPHRNQKSAQPSPEVTASLTDSQGNKVAAQTASDTSTPSGAANSATTAEGAANTSEKKQSNTGAIIGAVVGVVVGLAVIIGALVFCMRRRRRTSARMSDAETREGLVNEKGKGPASASSYDPVGLAGQADSAGYEYGSPGTSPQLPLPASYAAFMTNSVGDRNSVVSMGSNEDHRRALQASIANDAFERAKATANANAAANAAARNGVTARATDAADQAPPYWLTAGEEFGDDKERTG